MKIHISLNVLNLDASIAFYNALFGVSPHKIRPAYANFDVTMPPVKLALNEVSDTGGQGTLNHFGILLDTPLEVRAARERLIHSGLLTVNEEDTLCCHARQDKVWVFDPDGHAWEVYTILDDLTDADIAKHALEGQNGSACCAPIAPLKSRGLSLQMTTPEFPTTSCCK